jgi:hypothetical protein
MAHPMIQLDFVERPLRLLSLQGVVMNEQRTRRNIRIAGATMLMISLVGGTAARAQTDTDTGAAPPAAAADPARGILANMAAFLAAQPAFRVEILSAHDAVQASGEKIEFLDKRVLTVRRPNDMRMEVERSDGDRTNVVINKTNITAQHVNDNVYAQIEAKPSLDASLAYFINDLHMRLPLAMLLASDLPQELDKRVERVEYVEQTSILGAPAHHIAGSTDSVEFQIWVSAGKQPLPQRIVLTYPDAEGEPQFRASFSEWDLSPRVRDSTFEAKLDKGARRIAFLPQIKTASATKAAATTGAKK